MLVGTAGGGLLIGVSSSLPFAVFALVNVASIVVARSLGHRSLEAEQDAGLELRRSPSAHQVSDD